MHDVLDNLDHVGLVSGVMQLNDRTLGRIDLVIACRGAHLYCSNRIGVVSALREQDTVEAHRVIDQDGCVPGNTVSLKERDL